MKEFLFWLNFFESRKISDLDHVKSVRLKGLRFVWKLFRLLIITSWIRIRAKRYLQIFLNFLAIDTSEKQHRWIHAFVNSKRMQNLVWKSTNTTKKVQKIDWWRPKSGTSSCSGFTTCQNWSLWVLAVVVKKFKEKFLQAATFLEPGFLFRRLELLKRANFRQIGRIFVLT